MRKLLLSLIFVSLLVAQDASSRPVEDLTSDVGNLLEQEEVELMNEMYSPSSPNGACGSGGVWSLFGPSITMLLVICLAITLVYLLGTIFDSPTLSALAKQEGYEILLTAMIFVGFFSVWGMMNGIVGSFGLDDTLLGSASKYSKIMIIKISKDITSLGIFNTILYMYHSAPLKFGISMYSGISLNLGQVTRPLIDGISSSASLLSIALGEWLANLSLLCFINSVMIPVLLPIGLLLRSVPQLRGGGNALIAFAFALFVVYPLMITINYWAYEIRYGSYDVGASTPIQDAIRNFIAENGFGSLALMMIGIKVVTGKLGLLFWMAAISIFIATLKDVIYTVFVLSFFFGLVNIFVTLTFARELARFLGTEVNLSAFVKLI